MLWFTPSTRHIPHPNRILPAYERHHVSLSHIHYRLTFWPVELQRLPVADIRCQDQRRLIPAPLVNRLNDYFGGEENTQLFEQMFGEKEAMLFGEGYGKGIQAAGKAYNPEGVDFILFDLFIVRNYQPRESVEHCAAAFGLTTVPVVGKGTLDEAVAFVKGHPQSTLGDIPMEGIVCRPEQELRDRCGNRVICKIKWEDFRHFA